MHLNYEVLYSETFPLLKVFLNKGETVKAEAGAMVGMSPTIELEGSLDGGLLKGLGRMLSGEKIFFQNLNAKNGYGEVLLAPSYIGEILPLELDGRTEYIIQKDGFLASSMDIQIDTHVQNLAKGLLSSKGFFILKAKGTGTLFINSFGKIHPIVLTAGQTFIVDNTHLVAWNSTMDYSIELASKKGFISSITSGEGLVTRFTGPGTIFIQTRNIPSFVGTLGIQASR